MLLALSVGLTEVTDLLAPYMLVSRVMHSTIHLISTSVRAAQLRFVFFSIQYSIGVYWTVLLGLKLVA